MAVKRRIIWMSDEQWTRLKEIAGPQTVSDLIRGQFFTPRVETSAVQTARTIIERSGDTENAIRGLGYAFNSRPFTPAPKKGK